MYVFQVSRPYQRFWPDPKHFIVLKSNKKKKKSGHKTYGSSFFLRTVSISVYNMTFMKLKHFWDIA